MINSRQQLTAIPKPRWEWRKLNCQLKTKIEGKPFSVNLHQNIAFEDECDQGIFTKLNVLSSLDIEKSLQYDSSLGWNWHKSSNLPSISIKVQLQDKEDPEIYYPHPENLQARIFAVKIILNPLEKQVVPHLEDVGLRGVDKVEVKQGVGIFDGIRFKTTSYINQGVKFHLLLILYLKGQQESEDYSRLISSAISPPIFVDSRKSARDHFEKRFYSFAQVFDPILMQREYLKKSSKDKSTQYEIKVQNSMEGLYNYLTAPNIRHKVKHPLFLCVKFSNVFKILFNINHEQLKKNASNLDNILFILQNILINEIGKRRRSDKGVFHMERPFLISIIGQCSSSKKIKIYDCLDFLNCNSIQLVKYNYQIGSQFRNIFEAGNLIKSYNNIYEQLKEASMRIFDNKDNVEWGGDEYYGKKQLIQSQEDAQMHDQNLAKQNQKNEGLNIRRSSNIEYSIPNQANFYRSFDNNLLLKSGAQLEILLPTMIDQIDMQNNILYSIISQNMILRERLVSSYITSSNQLNYPNAMNLNFQSMRVQNNQNFNPNPKVNLSMLNIQQQLSRNSQQMLNKRLLSNKGGQPQVQQRKQPQRAGIVKLQKEIQREREASYILRQNVSSVKIEEQK